MNVQELRIGNYLQDREGRLCRVEKIETDGFYAPAIKGGFTSLPTEPIELTEQWLEDFNFYDEGNGTWQNEIALYEGLEGYNYDASFFEHHNFVTIHYVHQLQNLYFSLVGTELTCAPQS